LTLRADRGIVRAPCFGSSYSPFRYRDHVTGKWVKARYVAERHEIAARYAEWETCHLSLRKHACGRRSVYND